MTLLLATKTHTTKTNLQEIVKGMCKGQQWAKVALYDRFFEPAYHTAYRILKNQMAAEDAVHEGFIKAFKKVGTLKDAAIVEGWLKRIVMNEALQSIRTNKYFSDPVGYEIAQEAESIDAQSIPLAKLLQCIEELPDGYRIICQLSLLEEMSHDEIAKALDISASTSRSQLTRAKAKLRQIILDKGLLK